MHSTDKHLKKIKKITADDVKVSYNGEYPCLCMGHLIITIDKKKWDFGNNSLLSGGECYFENYAYDVVNKGPWSVVEWPKNFPEEWQDAVIEKVNNVIPWGCCGGCL